MSLQEPEAHALASCTPTRPVVTRASAPTTEQVAILFNIVILPLGYELTTTITDASIADLPPVQKSRRAWTDDVRNHCPELLSKKRICTRHLLLDRANSYSERRCNLGMCQPGVQDCAHNGTTARRQMVDQAV